MEGGANHWFQFWKMKTKEPTLEELMEALIKRFGGKERCSVFEKLVEVRQNGEIEKYIQDFEMLWDK